MKLRKSLKQFWTLDRHHAEGFTLVELIVVIAILAILGGVAIPAYSGYVEKANRAADEQLLSAVNRAYAAACVEKHQDAITTPGTATLVAADGGRKIGRVSSFYDKDGTSFDKYFEGNENSVFKVFTKLVWKSGVFIAEESSSLTYKNKEYTYQKSDIDAYKNSNFYGMGVKDTLVLMDNLVGMLQDTTNQDPITGKEVGPIVSLKGDADFMEFMAANGLYDPDDPNGPDNAQVASGFAFYAAEKLATADPNAIAAAMTNDASESINNMYSVISGGETPTFSDKALSAAVMYAMTASYAQANNLELPSGTDDVTDPGKLAGYLADYYQQDGFKEYIASSDAATDMAGLIGVMNTLETNDKNAQDMVENGSYKFDQRDLNKLIDNLLKAE